MFRLETNQHSAGFRALLFFREYAKGLRIIALIGRRSSKHQVQITTSDKHEHASRHESGGGAYNQKKGGVRTPGPRHYVCGKMVHIPLAPARVHARASSLIVIVRCGTDALSLWKTQELRCFQIHQSVSRTSEVKPRRRQSGDFAVDAASQSRNGTSTEGMETGSLHQLNISCQTCREKGQPESR